MFCSNGPEVLNDELHVNGFRINKEGFCMLLMIQGLNDKFFSDEVTYLNVQSEHLQHMSF